MELITFDQLPNAVSKLYSKLENIERLLLLKSEPQQPTDHWFDLNELCNYLPDKPAKPTVYGWVSSLAIPYHKKSKKLSFLKSEIDTWLMAGRKQTYAEIEATAQNFNGKKKRR